MLLPCVENSTFSAPSQLMLHPCVERSTLSAPSQLMFHPCVESSTLSAPSQLMLHPCVESSTLSAPSQLIIIYSYDARLRRFKCPQVTLETESISTYKCIKCSHRKQFIIFFLNSASFWFKVLFKLRALASNNFLCVWGGGTQTQRNLHTACSLFRSCEAFIVSILKDFSILP